MGLFDWMHGVLGRTAKNEEKALPRESLRGRREFSIEGLERDLELAKKRELDVSGKPQSILSDIQYQLGELKLLAKKIKARTTDPQATHAAIRESMRKNFVERTLLLDPPEMPRQLDYRALAEYHARLLKFLEKATKNVSDNRYLFHFFSEDMKAFAYVVKVLCAQADELESVLREKAGAASAYAELEGMLKAIGERQAAQAKLEELLREETAALQELENAAEKAEDSPLETQLAELGLKEAQLVARRSELRAKTADAFGPLKRLLRKYAHDAPKKDKVLAQKYADDATKALFESGDAGECKTLFSRLHEFTAKEGGDVKLAVSHFPTETALAGMLGEHAHLAGQIDEVREKKRSLQAMNAERDARREEAKRLVESVERLKARIREERAERESKLAGIEKKAGVLLQWGDERKLIAKSESD